MTRQINFQLSTIDDIYVSSDTFEGTYKGKRLFAGYEGENEATRLSFAFDSGFDNYTITLLLSGDDLEETEVELSEDDEYDIPDDYMLPEIVQMKIKAVYGLQILYSPTINLWIKR